MNTVWLFTIILCDYRVVAPPQPLQALQHILFEIILPDHMLVVTVYWTLYHAETLIEYQGHQLAIIHTYVVHPLPLVTCIINFIMTDIVMNGSHILLLVPFAVIYGTLNYYDTKRTSKPLYSFLTWEDHTTAVIYSGLVPFTVAAFAC